MAVNQAISQLAQFRSEMELVVAELRRMRGEMGATKSMSGVGGGRGGAMGMAGGDPGNWWDQYQHEALLTNEGGTIFPQVGVFEQNLLANPLAPSKSAEDQMYKQMTRRRWVAMAGQINALVSIAAKGMGADNEVMQNITSGVSNVISSISWIFTANALLEYGTAGAGMVVMGTALLAVSWIDYIKKLNETDPIYQMGGQQKVSIVNGSVTYN